MDEEISEGTMKLDTVDCLQVNVLTWWVAVFELFFFLDKEAFQSSKNKQGLSVKCQAAYKGFSRYPV